MRPLLHTEKVYRILEYNYTCTVISLEVFLKGGNKWLVKDKQGKQTLSNTLFIKKIVKQCHVTEYMHQ